ncbi:hypothetical protein [Deinococcus ruber]|uniref:Uncharacterized protein n=1 Tax=Deinococcus ruber TaxID=1848197 RepID=A0A918CBV3_9DEIO|nr:hypothetical protein [Deinococcus ruber]GGR15746.1 hypothetical protein GCM10008957_30610 [Deinococcus ruber]
MSISPSTRIVHTTAHHCRIGHDIFEFRCLRFGYQVRLVEDALCGPWGYGLTLTQAVHQANLQLEACFQESAALLADAEQLARTLHLAPWVDDLPFGDALLF